MSLVDRCPPGPARPLAAILAHQGGWDELGLVLVPLVLTAVLLVVANRRARRLLRERERGPEAPGRGETGEAAEG